MLDWDAAAAQAVQGIGATVSTAGYIIAINSPDSGPLSGWVLAAGTVIALGGLLWSFFADDNALDQFAKFGALGKQAGAAADAPGWALCPSGKFSDWNPDTIEGLTLQLRAAEQLKCSFIAECINMPRSQPTSHDCALRLTPGSLRPDSRFHIEYEAKWVSSARPAQVTREAKGYCVLSVSTGGDTTKPKLRDHSGTFQENDVVKAHKVGDADVIDVLFRLKHSSTTVLSCGDGVDWAYGGAGNDSLSGGQGGDHLFGEAGNDTVYGGADDDELNGGTNNDLMDGGLNHDSYNGGGGVDQCIQGGGDTIVACTAVAP